MWLEQRWTNEGTEYQEVVHTFYEKPMVTPLMIMRDSALPYKIKWQTLTQEVIRVRKNTSECVEQVEKRK